MGRQQACLTSPTTSAREKRGLDSLTLACVGGVITIYEMDCRHYIASNN